MLWTGAAIRSISHHVLLTDPRKKQKLIGGNLSIAIPPHSHALHFSCQSSKRRRIIQDKVEELLTEERKYIDHSKSRASSSMICTSWSTSVVHLAKSCKVRFIFEAQPVLAIRELPEDIALIYSQRIHLLGSEEILGQGTYDLRENYPLTVILHPRGESFAYLIDQCARGNPKESIYVNQDMVEKRRKMLPFHRARHCSFPIVSRP